MVALVVLTVHLLPFVRVQRREEDVGTGPAGMNLRQVQHIDQRQRLLVDLRPADDEDGVGLCCSDGLFQAMRHGHTGILPIGITGDDDVLASRQRTAGKRLEGLAPHDDAVAHGHLLEVLHVGRQVAQQVALATDGPIPINSNYRLNGFHIAEF